MPKTEVIVLYNIILEVIWSLGSDLYSSLFIRSEPRGPAHIQGEGLLKGVDARRWDLIPLSLSLPLHLHGGVK